MCFLKQKIQYAVNSDLIVILQFNLEFPFYFLRKSIKMYEKMNWIPIRIKSFSSWVRDVDWKKQNEDVYVYDMGDKMLSLNK